MALRWSLTVPSAAALEAVNELLARFALARRIWGYGVPE
jgi:hypothetical protein